MKTRVRSHCNHTLVSESLLHFKILFKKSFCNFKMPFIKGQMGNKVLEVLFSALYFSFLLGWCEEEMCSQKSTQSKITWQRYSSAWIHLLKMYCAILHVGTSVDVQSTCKTKQIKLAPPPDISVMNVHQNQKRICAMLMPQRGLS